MNNVTLEGVVESSPLLRKDRNGKPFIRIPLFVEQIVEGSDGKERYTANHPTLTIFGKEAEWAAENVRAGDELHVEGILSVNYKIEENKKKYFYTVVAHVVEHIKEE